MFLDVTATTDQLQQILDFINNLDPASITVAVEKALNTAMYLLTGLGVAIAGIVARYNKIKTTLSAEALAEKSNYEKATAYMGETTALLTDVKKAMAEVQATQGDKLLQLEDDYATMQSMLMAVIKGGVVNPTVLLELGDQLSKVSEGSNIVVTEFTQALEEATQASAEAESLLDK